jgi:adenylate cyclase
VHHRAQITEDNERMDGDLRAFLRESGAAPEDVARAEAEGWLPLLVLDRILMPGRPHYDPVSLARASGLDAELLERLWRALGFPAVPPDARVFTERDLNAARRLVQRMAADALDRETLVQQVQVVSAAMARIATVEADAILQILDRLRADGLDQEAIALQLVSAVRWEDLAALIDYEHRLQLRAAIWVRGAMAASPDLAIGVGFADLSGYTYATAQLEAAGISALVARWEECAYDTVIGHGGRVVKTIGDEVLFVGLPAQVADVALALRDRAAADPALLPVRAGIAAGPVVVRAGDVYGPVVNLASRLTEIAPMGKVLAPGELRRTLDDERFAWSPEGTRHLRGIGEVATFSIERRG